MLRSEGYVEIQVRKRQGKSIRAIQRGSAVTHRPDGPLKRHLSVRASDGP